MTWGQDVGFRLVGERSAFNPFQESGSRNKACRTTEIRVSRIVKLGRSV